MLDLSGKMFCHPDHCAHSKGTFLPLIIHAHEKQKAKASIPEPLLFLQIPFIIGIQRIAEHQIDRKLRKQPLQELFVLLPEGSLAIPDFFIVFFDFLQENSALGIQYVKLPQNSAKTFIPPGIGKNTDRRLPAAIIFLERGDHGITQPPDLHQPLLIRIRECFPRFLIILGFLIPDRTSLREQKPPHLHAGKAQIHLLIMTDSHIIAGILLTDLTESLFSEAAADLTQLPLRQKRAASILLHRNVFQVSVLHEALLQLLSKLSLLNLVIIEGVLVYIDLPVLAAGVRTVARQTMKFVIIFRILNMHDDSPGPWPHDHFSKPQNAITKEFYHMNVTILCIGHMKDKSLDTLQREYLKRLSAFCKAEVMEVKDEANAHADRPAEAQLIKDREAERALEKIRPSDFCILLDLHGKEWSSEEFAAQLASWQCRASSLVFVIAGSLGPGEALLARANARWKLSDLTFTHLMTRVLVLEQIYRGFMIDAGRAYHK